MQTRAIGDGQALLCRRNLSGMVRTCVSHTKVVPPATTAVPVGPEARHNKPEFNTQLDISD